MTKKNKELPNFDKLWNYGEPEETQEKFLSILPKARGSDNKKYHLELLTQITRTNGLQQQFEKAHEYLDQVKASLTEETQVAKVKYLLERGRTFNSSKQKDKFFNLFLES